MIYLRLIKNAYVLLIITTLFSKVGIPAFIYNFFWILILLKRHTVELLFYMLDLLKSLFRCFISLVSKEQPIKLVKATGTINRNGLVQRNNKIRYAEIPEKTLFAYVINEIVA